MSDPEALNQIWRPQFCRVKFVLERERRKKKEKRDEYNTNHIVDSMRMTKRSLLNELFNALDDNHDVRASMHRLADLLIEK